MTILYDYFDELCIIQHYIQHQTYYFIILQYWTQYKKGKLIIMSCHIKFFLIISIRHVQPVTSVLYADCSALTCSQQCAINLAFLRPLTYNFHVLSSPDSQS